MAFPCNQFGNQEPSSEQTIDHFVKKKYGVTFPLFSKIEVNGPKTHPLYLYLKSNKSFSAVRSFRVNQSTEQIDIGWNFEKFLVNSEGTVCYRFGAEVEPYDIESEIKELLAVA